MAEPHVITAWSAKRREIERLIHLLKKRLKTATAELEIFEAAIRIFKSDANPSAPLVTRPQYASFRGDSMRVIFHALHAAHAAPSTWHLTELVMKERGLSLDDAKLCRTMEMRIRASLNSYRRNRGVLKSSRGPNDLLLWELTKSCNSVSARP